MSGNLIVIAAVFVLSTAVVVGLGLFLITITLDAKHRHRKRIARVGRKRMSGRLDLEDARMALLRHKEEANVFVSLSDALARFVPLMDTKRLRANMRRAHMTLSIGGFILISLLVSGAIGVGAFYASAVNPALLAVPSLFAGMFLTDRFITFRGGVIANRFMKQMPDALETVIRGIKSGLPVIECVGTVGEEFDEPIGGYFKAIAERVSLGEPIDAALWRTARIINRPEMDFLAIAITIQMETGGSLAEALGNLSELLRKRQQMKLKIRAISSEAKASALIIGALPFLMLGLLTFMSPDYVMPLFTDPRGQTMLMVGMGSITVGAFVMWRMTQFEI